MAPTETQRFQLRARLGELLEDEHVTTLMESLPPVHWSRLAAKDDLTALEEHMNARFDALRIEFDAKIDRGLARQTYVILAGVAATVAAAMIPIYIALFTGAAG